MSWTEERGVGRLRRVSLREVWPHEAHDFTAWLVDNLDVLNEHLEVPLASAEREQAAGTFFVDLVAEDADGRTVVIENQLERSNHDHLGKVLTYLVAYDASVAIWVVAKVRPEHASAISWLNDSSPASFYLFQVEAVRIGDSAAAPLLTKIIGPSSETRTIASTKQERSGRLEMRRRFWHGLLQYARTRTTLHANRRTTGGSSLGCPSPLPGARYNYLLKQHGTEVSLAVRRKDRAEWNKAVFDQLVEHRAEIEDSFGSPLAWDRMPGGLAAKVTYSAGTVGWADEERWDAAFASTVAAMIRLDSAIGPFLKQLRASPLGQQVEEGPGELEAEDDDEEP